jgi:amidohydrolase
MTNEELKRRVYQAIDRRVDEIIALGEDIRRAAELGFKEVRTARRVEEALRRLGLAPRTGLAFTGVRAEMAGRAGDGPTFAILGELDGLVVAGHPEADPATGAAHACGHNAQVAGMLGAAMGLLDAGVMDHLAGRVVFFAVPAEEGGDMAWRLEQVRAGKLEFLAGKQELLRLGHFDDIDLAMMIHTSWRTEDGKAGVPASNNGRVGKTARYIGRASHAGGAPHLGINALYAAHVGLAAINAVRETFRDEDTIRVHPIMTAGGSQVNVIPADVRLEMYVRGRATEGILDASLDGGPRRAPQTPPTLGSTPAKPWRSLDIPTGPSRKVDRAALVGAEHYRDIGHRTGCTDMGDVSQVIPSLHPYMGGARGAGHGADFQIVDKPLAYVAPAKALASMAVDLLGDGAAGAREVLSRATPRMTRAEYLALQRGLGRREVFDGAAEVAPPPTA